MDQKLRRLIVFVFQTYLFLLPLVFLPYNSELFEFNKTILTYLAAALLLGLWLARMVVRRQWLFRPTPFFWPLLLFFTSQAISTFISIHPYTSFWGYYSRFHQGLLSTISYLVLYWALSSNCHKNDLPRLLKAALLGTGFSAGWGFLEHFGIDKSHWIQDVQSRVFSTFGQPNWLAAYLAAAFFLIFSPLANCKKSAHTSLAAGLFLVTLYFTKSRSGFLGLLAGFAVFFAFQFLSAGAATFLKDIRRRQIKTIGFWLIISLVLISLNHNLFAFLTPHQNTPPPPHHYLITPSSKIREIVWQGAIKIWKRYPIFGTGTETFAYSYYWVRPIAHNLTSEWDFLYNKAHNEYLNFAANNGTVGLASYLLFPLAFFIWSWRRRRHYQLLAPFLAAFATILVTNFFGFSVTPIAVLFYLIPAMAVLSLQTKPPAAVAAKTPRFSQRIALIAIIAAAGWLIWQTGRYWQADYFYARAQKDSSSQQYLAAYQDARRAVQLRPHEAIYWSRLGGKLASLAFLSHQASPSSKEWLSLAQEATAASRQAIHLNPFHVNIYKEVARNYYLLASIKPGYFQQVITILQQASQLAPTDPKIYYNIGRILAIQGKNREAEKYLRKTVQLKTNYEAARWQLAQLYHQTNRDQLARRQLEFILKRIDPASSPAAKLLKRLKN